MPSQMRPGDVLAGRYRLVVLLSESGGGLFYRALDQVLARHVALHLIPEDDERAEGLMAAARASATLHDPHLLRVLDTDRVDGYCYVVNEWGEGRSLDILLQDGPLLPRRAAWLVSEVGALVAAGHTAGLAHGRLVPENVLIDEAGAVKVIGFAVDAALHGLPPGRAATDVVDLAGVLYAALTGRWPGVSASTLPPAPQEHGRPLRPRQVRAGVPRILDTLCEEVLSPVAPTRDHGYNSAQAIVDALCDFVGDPAAVAEAEAASARGNTNPRLPRIDAPLAPPTPEAEPEPGPGPDETVAGAPVFYDHLDEVGWSAPSEEAAPPPPPFEEPAARPLFAPEPPDGGPSRVPRSPQPESSRDDSRSDSGDYWPWGGAPTPFVSEEDDDNGAPGRGWVRIAAIVALVLIVLFGMAWAFQRGRDDASTDDNGAPQTSGNAQQGEVPVAAAHDFDPLADPPEENPESARLAVDGDPETAWQTSRYLQDLGPGGLKEGVGLVLDLGEVADVTSVELAFGSAPTVFELFAAPEDASLPGSLAGLDPVAGQTATGETATVEFDTATTRYLVVWLTSLPAVKGGFRGQVAEVKVFR